GRPREQEGSDGDVHGHQGADPEAWPGHGRGEQRRHGLPRVPAWSQANISLAVTDRCRRPVRFRAVAEQTESRDLRDYARLLRRRKGLIVLVTIMVVAAAVAASLVQTPVYQARADVLV